MELMFSRWLAALLISDLLSDMQVIQRKAVTNLDSILKSRDINLPTKVHLIKAIVFPVVKYECESWTIEQAEHWKLMVWTVVLEKIFESPLDCKEIQVHPKGNQPWIFIGRTDVETPILWPPDGKNWLIGKDPDAGKDWRREEKGMTGMRQLDVITDSIDMNLSKLQELVME